MGGTWAGENHSFFRNLLLIIDPTFIPHRFGILDFGFKVFCQELGADHDERLIIKDLC